MSTDGFLVCPVHGDIFWCAGADGNSLIEAHNVEPLHASSPTPVLGDEVLCFCGQRLRPEVRPAVRVIR